VVFYRFLPVLTTGQEPLNVLIYDAGNSALGAYLENSQTIEAWTGYEDETHMMRKLAHGQSPELGLVIPADFDQALESGGEAILQGYVMYWVAQDEAVQMKRQMEAEIAALLGRPVVISLDGNTVYHSPEASGLGVQAAMGLIFAVLMIGLTMIPHLMLAEKQSRTLDVLLVSPASESHIVIAKALTGLFYCLIGAGVALAINHDLVVHWWLAILGVVFFSLFAVSLGLLLGTKIENRGQLSIWAWVLIIPLFMPLMLYLLEELFPKLLIQIVRWVPTSVAFDVLRHAFADPIPLGRPLLGLIYLTAWFVLGLAGVVWLVRRRDRESQAITQIWQEAPAGLATEGILASLRAVFPRARQPKAIAPMPVQPSVNEVEVGEPGETSSNQSLRIILAITAKDMREALKNKILLSILLGTALVIINGAALPMLLELRDKPAIMIYDEGRSTIIRGLAGRDDFRLAGADSQQEMQEAVSEGPGTWLGLVIPADFDQMAGGDQVIELDGYAAHWADADKLSQWTTLFEKQLGLATWGTVSIDLGGGEVYPSVEAGGQIAINLLTLIIAVSAIGIALVPLLMVEEKEAGTMDALLVSPARLSQVITGKALVGFVYCLVAALVAILFNRQWIVHWDIVLLATLLVTAVVVAMGLLVGLQVDNPTSAGLWTAPLILFLLLPVMLLFFAGESLPPLVESVLQWLPGSLMLKMFRLSVAGEVPAVLLWSSVAVLAGMAAALYLLVGWRMKRLEQ
jgi:ABC-2 type transport system permease protein